MSKTNENLIGAVEKRELAKLVNDEFNRIIDTMKQEIKFTQGEILEEAKNKFGIECINKEIDHLKEKITMLETKKKDLGFDSSFNSNGFKTRNVKGGYDQEIDPSTKAGRFYYLKIARHGDIKSLEKQRDDRLKNLWLENQRPQIKTLVNIKIDVQQIELKKKK